MTRSASFAGWWEIDLDTLALADGDYEYELVIDGDAVAADPYAESITRFGGYRGIFTISGGRRVRQRFDWSDEFVPGTRLPGNNEIVIYEMPVRWMSSDPGENAPFVELGTFDKVLFEHLNDLRSMGINCIELLPIQDSPQTLNWGYGTRFFFAPDYDIGSPVDLKFLIKSCHRAGIRVLLDVVMNMYPGECPLDKLATPWFYEPQSEARNPWGQNLFRYRDPAYASYFAAREFQYEMGEFWVSEYHVDGYRIDEFKSIDNWEFIQTYRDRVTGRSQSLFPGKPFIVIAEDTNRRFNATKNGAYNGRNVVDAMWNFGYRDEIRRLLADSIQTEFGRPSRSVRVRHLISKDGVWNDYGTGRLDDGYDDMACAVDYITSHDVADAPRLMNTILGPMLGARSIRDVSAAVDGADWSQDQKLKRTVRSAFERVFGGFAILMTSAGMPMLLAGEEFGDVHDTDPYNGDAKQQDPVQWNRAAFSGNAALKSNVRKLIQLRTSHPALKRNEVEFFYFHPRFDDNDAPRVFAYCRTGGQSLGNPGQVIVIANMGPADYPNYDIPGWRWANRPLIEVGDMTTGPVSYNGLTGAMSLALRPFAVRVFTT